MTKYIKTYGIRGLLEWYGTVSFGSMRLNVSFTNGSVTAYGVAPATFTTKNELHQFIIENSADFEKGRIFVVNSHPYECADEPVVEEKAVEDQAHEEVVVTTASEGENVIEVADKNEAVEYLKEHCDASLTATKLRSQSAFDAACAKHNVKFIFTE